MTSGGRTATAMRPEAVLVTADSPYFTEWAVATRRALGRYFGIVRTSIDGVVDVASPTLYLVLGDVDCMDVPQQIRRQLAERRPRRAVFALWYTERLPILGYTCQPAEERFAKFREQESVYDSIHSVDLGMVEFLIQQGMAAHHAPVGFDGVFDARLPTLEAEHDVLFNGEVNDRRARIIEGIEALGPRVTVGFGQFGMARSYAMAISRSYLNLHYDDYPMSESLRFVHGMGNRVPCISESIAFPQPFVPGEHFVMATPDELPRAVEALLASRTDAAAMVARAYDFLSKELTMERVVGSMLDHIARS